MQVFERSLIETHCVGEEWPQFCGTVSQGERFAVETVEVGPNGPVEVRGVRRGDAICISVDAVRIEPPFYAPQSGPTFLGCGEPIPLRYEEGWFWWPAHFCLRARPSVGNVAVLPEPDEEIRELCRYQIHGPDPFARNLRGWRRVVRDTRGKHCHQDCAALAAGARIYMRANVHGAGVCIDDVHGYIGEGELGFGAIEVNATVELTVERSDRWAVDWPVIETGEEFMVVVSYTGTYVRRPVRRYVDLVKEAYIELRRLVSARLDIPVEEANTITATACDIRNCALYGLGENYIPRDRGRQPYDIAIAASLPRSIFADAE